MKRDTNKRKQEIIDAAITLFLKQGVQETSLREIAVSLGISKSTILYYFHSKDEIIDQVANNGAQRVNTIREYYRSLGNIKPSDGLRKCIIRFLVGSHWRNVLFFNREFKSLPPARSEGLSTSVREYINFFEHLLDEGIRIGEFKMDDPFLVAFNIWTTEQEWALRHWLLKESFNNEEFAEKQADFILSAILVNKPTKVDGSGLIAQRKN